MAQVELTKQTTIAHGNVAIVQVLDTVRGGRTLDMAGFPHETLKGGHIILQDTAGNAKPLALNSAGNAYASVPSGHTVLGFLTEAVSKANPQASILIHGTVNPKACPFAMDDTLLKKVKADCPHVVLLAD